VSRVDRDQSTMSVRRAGRGVTFGRALEAVMVARLKGVVRQICVIGLSLRSSKPKRIGVESAWVTAPLKGGV
jgi:hypothetical protein